MAEICSCSTGIVNFGQPDCVDSFERDARLIFVNYLDDTGAVNSITSADTLDSTFFDGKWNSTNLSQRWYPTQTIDNVVGERADSVTEDISGIPFNVKQGIRLYDGMFKAGIANPTYLKSLNSVSCRQMGFFIIDVLGNIIGLKNDISGDLDPIKIRMGTFQTKYAFPDNDSTQGISLKFAWEETERDADLSFVGAGNIAVDMLIQKGMTTTDFQTPATLITTTTFRVAMDFTYGEAFVKEVYQGAVIGDFVLVEISPTPGAIVITSVTPVVGTPGSYDFVIPAATAADVLSLTYQKTAGRGFESVTPLSITIP